MLTLIKFSEQHRATLLSHLSLPSISASLPDFSPETVNTWADHILTDQHSFVILLDNTMIGACRLEKNDHSDFSYWIHPDYQGRGFATQINNKLCRMAISLGWTTISGYCDPSNTPSQTVLKRCGFNENNNVWTKYL